MRQIENKTYGATGFNGAAGRRKMHAANKIAFHERQHKKRRDIEKRNAYRRACGLPEIGA